MTVSALDTLLYTLKQPFASDEDTKKTGRAFIASLPNATPQQVQDALEALTTFLHTGDLSRAGYAALVVGTMFERGYHYALFSQPFIERLTEVLTACTTFAARSHALLVERGTAEEDIADAFEDVQSEVAALLPREARALEAFDLFWRPGIALFSFSPQARKAAQPLRPLTHSLAQYHDGAGWLDTMLSTLFDEPMLVIEPETHLGFQGTMTGVVDNFQLHVLLMDAFPFKGVAQRRVSQHVVDVAKGKGPQQIDDVVKGEWNLYAWTAIQPTLQLLPPGLESAPHWLWGEGTPNDIPLFEGQRVVLLGPPLYARAWTAQRLFAHLPAAITQTTVLDENEVTAWLRKMASARE